MAIIVAVSAGGVAFLLAFLLTFLRALLHEPKGRPAYYALLLEPLLWSGTESEPGGPAGKWARESYD